MKPALNSPTVLHLLMIMFPPRNAHPALRQTLRKHKEHVQDENCMCALQQSGTSLQRTQGTHQRDIKHNQNVPRRLDQQPAERGPDGDPEE